jgi:carboxyl-terminal processing protease
MRKLKYSLMVMPAIVLLTLAFCFRQNKTTPHVSSAVSNVLMRYHYEPKEIDDKLSKELFALYIKRWDSDKRFFLKEDIDSLKNFETLIDDELKSDNLDFFNKVNAMLLARISRAEVWYTEFLAKPFDFKKKEYLEYDEKNAEFLKSESDLKEYWRKNLKRQVLEKLASKLEIQDKAAAKKDTVIKIKPYDTLELDARNEVLKTHSEWFKRIRKLDENEKLNIYINCLSEIYDPHTSYFPPIDKENFDIRMSGKLEGIGAQLQEKDGLLKVVSIVPGSPSYKQGQLKGGDIILKVAQGDKEAVDVTNMKIDDAIQLIRGPKGTEVRLTVRKPDESVIIISIIRDVVEMEESYAKSAVYELNGNKYGYIHLPSFYLDMNGRGGRSCSKDVAKEIQKLKESGVKGIALDLRNNGGGSLGDVVDMAGLFIKDGPITLVKPRDKKPEVLEDEDSRIQWDGPLTIMVNENSASASEILAAAMQDYKRALIIGTPTYGKGTVQTFVDLDKVYSNETGPQMGSLKITIQKFYRVNGTTTQLKGVVPDVIIPDRYRYLEFGEKENEYALSSDKISKANYDITKKWEKPLQTAKENSLKRIASDVRFQEIETLAKKIQTQSNRTKFTLNLEEYREELKANELDNKKYEEVMKDISSYTIVNTDADEETLKSDDNQKKIKTDWNNARAKDIYIQEAIKILSDLH